MPVLRAPPGGSNRGFTQSARPLAPKIRRSRIVPQLEDIAPPGGGGGGALPPDLELEWLPGSLPSEVTHGGFTNGSAYDAAGVFVPSSSDGVTHDPVTLECLGKLGEGARNQYLPHPNALENWPTWQISISADAASSPDGTSNADTLTADAVSDGASEIYQDTIAAAPAEVTLSGCFADGTGDHIALSVISTTGPETNRYFLGLFNIDTGAIEDSAVGPDSGTIVGQFSQPAGAGFHRVAVSGYVALGTTIYVAQAGAFNSATLGSVSDYGEANYTGPSIALTGAYLNFTDGRYPTSIIAVNGLRTAATFDITDADWCGAQSWKVKVRSAFGAPASGVRQVVASAGTSANGWTVFRDHNREVWLEVRVSSSVTALVSGGTLADNTDAVIGWRVVEDDCNIAVNGVAGIADTNCLVPTPTAGTFCHDASDANHLDGPIRKAWSWLAALNDNNLEAAFGDETSGAAEPVEIAAGLGRIEIAGLAPAVHTSAHVTIVAGLGHAELVGLVPAVTVSDHIQITAGLGAAELVGLVPTVATTANVEATAGLGRAELTGLVPTVSTTANVNTVAELGEIELTGLVPTVHTTAGVVVTAGLGLVVLEGLEPAVETTENVVIRPATGALALQGLLPLVEVTENAASFPASGSMAIEGLVPTVSITAGVTVFAGLGRVALQGLVPTVVTTGNAATQAGLGKVDLRGLVPSVSTSADVVSIAGLGRAELRGLVPLVGVTGNQVARAGLGRLALVGLVPQVVTSVAVDSVAGLGRVELRGLEPTVDVTAHQVVRAGLGRIELAGLIPAVDVSGKAFARAGLGRSVLLGLVPMVDAAGLVLPVPPNRSVSVGAENRRALVAAEVRLARVSAEPRLVAVAAENRSASVAAENRSVVVAPLSNEAA